MIVAFQQIHAMQMPIILSISNLDNGRELFSCAAGTGKTKWREDIDSAPAGKFPFNIYESVSEKRQLGDGSQKVQKARQ